MAVAPSVEVARPDQRRCGRKAVARDPWTVVGVDRSCSYADARRAYLVRSQILHPDRHHDAGPEVLAEAGRAMRELNEAWESLRAYYAAGPPGTSGTDRLVVPDVEVSPQHCLDWVLRRLSEVARDQGDPLLPEELDRLRQPLAGASRGRRTRRWLAQRRATLHAAIAQDSRRGESARWETAIRVLVDSGPRVVFLLLLQRS
jgi:hypothetical protein